MLCASNNIKQTIHLNITKGILKSNVENKQRYKHNHTIPSYSTGRYFKQSLYNKTCVYL